MNANILAPVEVEALYRTGYISSTERAAFQRQTVTLSTGEVATVLSIDSRKQTAWVKIVHDARLVPLSSIIE